MRKEPVMFCAAVSMLFLTGGCETTGQQYRGGLRFDEVGNSAEAAKCYRAAAERGHVQARLTLARRYYDGRGVTKDYAEAVKWYRLAAEQDSPEAWYALGQLCKKGEGMVKDPVDAAKCFRKAAEWGRGCIPGASPSPVAGRE